MFDILSTDERVALLREQLSDAPAVTRSARRLGECPAANILIGAALHGAARRERGMELTDLERRLTDQLAALFGEDLLAEFGRVYAEPASRKGAAALFPALVAERSWEQGVDEADVRAFASTVTAEVAKLPTAREISVEDLAAGVLTGEEEVVVVTGAPTKGTEFEVDELYEVRVRFVKFYCDRRSNEVGHDEIYWASGAASELRPQIVMLTPEYGSIQAGSERNFGENAFWFKGPAEKFVGGHIQVWEADPGGNNQSKLRVMLADAARQFAEAALEEGPTWDAVLLGVVAGISGLINWILGFNKDDLVKEMSIAYTRDALNRMAAANGGRSTLVFDGGGGGKHTLTIEVSRGPVVAAGLNHSIFYNNSWSTPVRVPHLVAASRPSMVSAPGGDLYAAYVDIAGTIKITRYDGESWGAPVIARDAASGTPVRADPDTGVTMLMHEGRMLIHWAHFGSTLTDLSDVDPHNGTLRRRARGGVSTGQPALLSAPTGDLLLFFESDYGMVDIHALVGDEFKIRNRQRTQHGRKGLGAVVYKGRSWLFGLERTADDRVHVRAWSSGDAWHREHRAEPAHTFFSAMAPAAAVAALGAYNNPQELMFVSGYWRDQFGGPVSTAVFDETTTRTWTTHNATVLHGLNLAYHQGTLHALYW
ncbi:hypothetical protein [Streptomyces eurythermus]|uniref:hypothetical protein n=1 Tax=Streptomyces eurythermus TaxID=42237 RepID=UPI0036D34300